MDDIRACDTMFLTRSSRPGIPTDTSGRVVADDEPSDRVPWVKPSSEHLLVRIVRARVHKLD